MINPEVLKRDGEEEVEMDPWKMKWGGGGGGGAE